MRRGRILWGSGFRTCQNLIQWKDDWHGRSTLLPWWPLLQTWDFPYVSLCSNMSTCDWDLFLGPLEWARAETSGGDRWVLYRRGFPGVDRVYSPPCPWDTNYQFPIKNSTLKPPRNLFNLRFWLPRVFGHDAVLGSILDHVSEKIRLGHTRPVSSLEWAITRTPVLWFLTYPTGEAPFYRTLCSLVVRETWLLGCVSPRMHGSPQTLIVPPKNGLIYSNSPRMERFPTF